MNMSRRERERESDCLVFPSTHQISRLLLSITETLQRIWRADWLVRRICDTCCPCFGLCSNHTYVPILSSAWQMVRIPLNRYLMVASNRLEYQL